MIYNPGSHVLDTSQTPKTEFSPNTFYRESKNNIAFPGAFTYNLWAFLQTSKHFNKIKKSSNFGILTGV
jgi:hypothetical protein